MKLTRSLTLLILTVFFLSGAQAQMVYPINIYDGQLIESCHGVFTHSGEDPQVPYAPGEDYSLTFCNDTDDNRLMHLMFRFLEIGNQDTLFIYDGIDDQAVRLAAISQYQLTPGDSLGFYASGACMHFRFVSSQYPEGDTQGRMGWSASLQCKQICEVFVAEIIAPAGLLHCQAEGTFSLSLTADAGYLADLSGSDPDNFQYNWEVMGQSYTGRTITHDFPGNPGAYPVYLSVYDALNECEATANEQVKVATIPSLQGTRSSNDSVCAGIPFTLIGETRPVTWVGFQIEAADTVFIPDATGEYYERSLSFDVFSETDAIATVFDIDRICVNIEHMEYRQLRFELQAPGGTQILLKDYGQESLLPDDHINLGEPVVFHPHIPGKGYEYCFTPAPEFDTMNESFPFFHSYTDQSGDIHFANYLPPGNYAPEQALSALIGSDMNGTWTLRVRDNTAGLSGHVFSWRLLFDESFYPDSLIFTPGIVSERWYYQSQLLSGNPVNYSVEDPGDHTFRFEVTDDFGCVHDTLINVYIRALPKAEIVSEFEVPLCQGDSTLLTVLPVDGDNFFREFQWLIGSSELPGAIYDTLTVKEPVTYSVRVTDTQTGCLDIFSFDLADINCDLFIPNVFTPNGDGINDTFEILLSGKSSAEGELYQDKYELSQIVIYNRWGARVFQHDAYFSDGDWWDGRGQPDGTYFYVLKYGRMGEIRFAEGSVTIIR